LEADLVAAVQKSGYPLQTVVALELRQQFRITEEWGFIDRSTKEHRSLDIFAFRKIEVQSEGLLSPDLTLLIECKRSELPWIFFKSVAAETPSDFPSVFGFRHDSFELHKPGGSFRLDSAAEFMKLHELSFIKQGPPLCNAFAGCERSGKSILLSGSPIFNNVVLPLVSAQDHLREFLKDSGGHGIQYPSLVLCVCIFDGPMIIADGPPEAPELVLVPWVRVRRHESTQDRKYRNFMVDLIHRSFLGDFVKLHLIPFAESFGERIITKERLLAEGKGLVRDCDNWQWAELRSV
jgi:hypothetical protein